MKIIKRLARLDKHMKEVLVGASVALVLRGAGAGLAFLFNVAVAKLLGAEGVGLFFMALSVTMMGSVVARMGLDNSLIRFIADNAVRGEWGEVKGVHALGLKIGGGASIGLALLLTVMAPWIAVNLFNEPRITDLLRWMSLAIASFSVMTIFSESLKGLKRIRDSMLISGVFSPVFGLVLIWPLIWFYGTEGAGVAYFLATLITSICGWYFWHRAVALHTVAFSRFSASRLWESSRPLWFMMMINRALLPWLPLFLLGIWAQVSEVGQYGAATRVVMLVSFFLTAVNTIIGPKLSELNALGDGVLMRNIIRRFSLLITLASVPLFYVMIFHGGDVMLLFGKTFAGGASVLAILAIGQAITTITGLAGFLLIMAGYERDVQNTSLFALVLLLPLSFALIPSLGMIGAAWATVLATAGSNILSAYMVWRRLKINVLPH